MIFYGTKPIHVKSENAPIIKCPSCEEQGGMSYHYYSSHVHLYWIPFFPYSRKGFSSCQKCGDETLSSQMNDHQKRGYDSFKQGTRAPIWQFSGLILIVLFVGYMIYDSKIDQANYKEYIASPRPDDVYRYKISYKEYSTLKIAEITEDTIYVIPNEYLTSLKSGVEDIDLEKNYGELMYGISRDEIQRMFDEKEIYEIDRQ